MTTKNQLNNACRQQTLSLMSQRLNASLQKIYLPKYTRRKLAARYKLALNKHDREASYYHAIRRNSYLPANGQRTRSNAKTVRQHGRPEKTQISSTRTYN